MFFNALYEYLKFCMCNFFSWNFQCIKNNDFKLVTICYSFCVLADDTLSNLAKRHFLIKNKEHEGMLRIVLCLDKH